MRLELALYNATIRVEIRFYLMQIIKDDIFILITQWIIRINYLPYWPRAMRTIGFCVCKRTHIEIIGLAKMNN